MKKILKIATGFIFLVVSILSIYVFYLYREAQMVVQNTQIDISSTRKKDLNDQLESNQTLSILFLGIDTGEYGQMDQARADTIMLALVNPSKERTLLISIARDTYTSLGKTGEMDKINHSYAFGGLDLTVESVSQMLGVEIDYGIVLNMTGLKQLVDTVGGIEVNNSTLFEQDGYTFNAGKIYLDGTSTLAYARMRKDDPEGDYGRQRRQREVVSQVVDQLGSTTLFFNYSKVLRVLEDNSLMNITLNDFIRIGSNYRYVNAVRRIEEVQLVGEGTLIDGISYQVVPEEQLASIKKVIQEEMAP